MKRQKNDTLLDECIGIATVVMGVIIMLASFITLIRLRGQKNIRFLRIMISIILVTGLMELIEGAIILQLLNIDSVADGKYKVHFICKGVALILYNLGSWTIIWHVSFKYWETARQLSRVVRMYQSEVK